jgi:mono/diheme cytochrome c family protein
MKATSTSRAFAIFVVLALTACATAAGAGQPGADAPDPGRDAYLRYCGACHGPEGKGDGIAGTFMRPKPTDLTQLAARNDGKFPFQATMHAIDGTETPRAHGDPVMPVWGELFAEKATTGEGARSAARRKVQLITEYIRTIQTK